VHAAAEKGFTGTRRQLFIAFSAMMLATLLAALDQTMGRDSAQGEDLSEELRQRLVGIQRENMRDILVGTDDHYTAIPADAAHVEDVACLWVRAKCLLVVDEAERSFSRKQDRWQVVDCEIRDRLLEDGADIDDSIRLSP